MRVFLIGGGWSPGGLRVTLGPFVRAAGAGGPAAIACVLHRAWSGRAGSGLHVAVLRALGAATVRLIVVGRDRPLRAPDLDGITGLFVGGGLPSAYHAALWPTAAEWLPVLRARAIPYAGYSAGALIAPEAALLGGWRARVGDRERPLTPRRTAEGLHLVCCRPGLGLVPFIVDAHAAQWGTLPRLLHAVAAGWADEGWALDEHTMVEVNEGVATVHGTGLAYRARQTDHGLVVAPLAPGTSCRIGNADVPGADRSAG